MKDQLIQVFEELKSTRTILALLQEDIVKLNANHDSKSFQCEQPFVHDQASINWRPVLKNGYKKCKKPTVSNRQLIPLSNRFTPLSDEQGSTVLTEVITLEKEESSKDSATYKKKPSDRPLNKVLILGDSHARSCAQGVKHNLNHNVEVQGIVKPGADMETIISTSIKSVEKFTNKDIVVIWGGTRDVGKNESAKGLHQLKNFVEQNNQTNFIVIGVPHRYDLDLKSCVNEEVKVYNRKLKKCLKTCEHTVILEIDSNRDIFTKHGLHLNSKGKDQITEKIAQTIQVRLNRKKNEPIILKDREIIRTFNEDTKKSVEIKQAEVKEVQLTHEDQIGSIPNQDEDKLPPKRRRKPPNTRHNDFLWLDKKTNQM
jgi:RNase H-fold protein (predicted Holliday junction resolvase)